MQIDVPCTRFPTAMVLTDGRLEPQAAVLAGRTGAIRCLTAMFAFSYLWIVALLFLRLITPWLSLAFLSIPVAVRAVQGFNDNLTPARMMPAMQATARTNTLFGLAIVLAIVLRVAAAGRL